ncbi:Glycerate kinase [Trichoplax sp. H2]|nr:Glycerate kinase [Trichoplax sp. H2]|eukprot:RDD44549.1 Glycerate kinase [Trichoplax sp. H2]
MVHISSSIGFKVIANCGYLPGALFSVLPRHAVARCYSQSCHDGLGTLKENAKQILTAALQAVAPETLVQRAIRRSACSQYLHVGDATYPLQKNVYIAAFGKGVYPMAKAVTSIVHDHLVDGIVSVPAGSSTPALSNLQIIQGGRNNLPDSNSMMAADSIMKMANSLGQHDILLVLMTGGGSALFPLPVHGVTLDEKLQAIKAIANAGGDIFQLNTIRKNLSACKGGKLALAANPAKVISFIVSDVIGDNLEIIASGPTVKDSSSHKDCLTIIKNLSIDKKIPTSVLNLFSGKTCSDIAKNKQTFNNVQNVLIGSNKVAIHAAFEKASQLGFDATIHSTTVCGEAKDVGKTYCQMLLENQRLCRKVCILSGGETTVRVEGSGVGGRNQEFALSASVQMFESKLASNLTDKKCPAVLLSAGTDGQDGPTPAAGAFAYPGQLCDNNINTARHHLANNDSYTFFSTLNNGDDLIVTGLTNTNVMDIQIMLIDEPTT